MSVTAIKSCHLIVFLPSIHHRPTLDTYLPGFSGALNTLPGSKKVKSGLKCIRMMNFSQFFTILAENLVRIVDFMPKVWFSD